MLPVGMGPRQMKQEWRKCLDKNDTRLAFPRLFLIGGGGGEMPVSRQWNLVTPGHSSSESKVGVFESELSLYSYAKVFK